MTTIITGTYEFFTFTATVARVGESQWEVEVKVEDFPVYYCDFVLDCEPTVESIGSEVYSILSDQYDRVMDARAAGAVY